jgi:hypothetical protein
MRNPYFAAVMAVVLVVTIGGGPAVAQEPDENAMPRAEATLPAEPRAPFDVTPGMARMLSQPVRTPEMTLLAPTGAHYLAQRSRTGGGASNKVVAGVSLGFAGLLAGAAIGPMLEPDCHCGDQGMAGGFFGAIIGASLGALFGVWIAGR